MLSKYLEIVYPTSQKIFCFSQDEKMAYYEGLRYFYRVPLKENAFTGLFSKINSHRGVFMHPDTIAIDARPLPPDFSGFIEDTTIEGSNGRYIEISSFGWLQYPYGAYYNWAKGSGVYVNTGKKTIACNTKLSALYRIYKENNIVSKYIETLMNDKTIIQILIGQTSIPDNLNEIIDNDNIDKKYLEHDSLIIGNIPTLLGSLFQEDWGRARENLKKYKNSRDLFRALIIDYFIPDHLDKRSYDDLSPLSRFRYLMGEVSGTVADQDRWLYFTAKQFGYDLVQLTRQPNRLGVTTFELMDTRWPAIDRAGAQTISITEGLQSCDIKFAWNKALSEGFFSMRDPFDLMNPESSVVLKTLNTPPVSTQLCARTFIENPPADFDPSWLPEQGWGQKQCELGLGSFPSDTLSSWLRLQPSPFPLNKAREESHLVHFAVDGSKHGGFSAIDVQHNVDLASNMAEEKVSRCCSVAPRVVCE